jgi:hypothetical protein
MNTMQTRFVADSYGDGYAVVDAETGRPVTGVRDSRQSAAATAQILNRAAAAGGNALARALGAADKDEPYAGVRF